MPDTPMGDWIKILLSSSFMVGLLALLGKMLGWRFSPREKADVQKTESEVKINTATINSKRIEDEIKVSQQALEWTAQFAAQLEKANAVIDKLQSVIDKMRIQYTSQIEELEKQLDLERKNCGEIKKELDNIKQKYGLSN